MTSTTLHESNYISSINGKIFGETKIFGTKGENDVLATYSLIVNHLLETYATNDEDIEEDKDKIHFTRPTNLTRVQFSNAL